MKRRTFLKNSISSVSVSTIYPEILDKAIQDYKLSILATNWGFKGSLEDFFKKAKNHGYHGVELWWPKQLKEQENLRILTENYGMEIGFLCGSGSADFDSHFKEFASNLNSILNSDFKPLYINCHAGKDFFSEEENSKIIEYCIEMSDKYKVKILQETHRGRMCFSTINTLRFLKKYPKLILTLDISHWCNVHESMLEDQKETVDFALSKSRHIHARIGHEEGPQVNDPRAPEWQSHVEKHLKWWDQAVKNQIASGEKQITFLTEFGPPNYMPVLPYTKQPLADQWEINVYMKDLILKRYGTN